MASHIGILSPVLTPPSGAVLERSEQTSSTKPVKLEGTNGSGAVVTVVATTEKYFTTTLRISGKGVASISAITAGPITVGTPKLTSAKQEEDNKGYPGFDYEAISYGNLPTS